MSFANTFFWICLEICHLAQSQTLTDYNRPFFCGSTRKDVPKRKQKTDQKKNGPTRHGIVMSLSFSSQSVLPAIMTISDPTHVFLLFLAVMKSEGTYLNFLTGISMYLLASQSTIYHLCMHACTCPSIHPSMHPFVYSGPFHS